MSKKEVIKRYILFIISLFFCSPRSCNNKARGELGVSPISSVPNVMSSYMDSFSLGTWLIIWNCILIAGQILILKRFSTDTAFAVTPFFPFRHFYRFRCVVHVPCVKLLLCCPHAACACRHSNAGFRRIPFRDCKMLL